MFLRTGHTICITCFYIKMTQYIYITSITSLHHSHWEGERKGEGVGEGEGEVYKYGRLLVNITDMYV